MGHEIYRLSYNFERIFARQPVVKKVGRPISREGTRERIADLVELFQCKKQFDLYQAKISGTVLLIKRFRNALFKSGEVCMRGLVSDEETILNAKSEYKESIYNQSEMDIGFTSRAYLESLSKDYPKS